MTTAMDDLVTWLQLQVAEDERLARDAMKEVANVSDPEGGDTWVVNSMGDGVFTATHGTQLLADPYGYLDDGLAGHIVNWQPTRVLAECEAQRRIIAEHTTLHTVVDGFCVEEGGACTHAGEAACPWCGTDGCRTLRLVALPYADRSGYREGWRP